MGCLFKIYGRIDLDGRHGAIIQTDYAQFGHLFDTSGETPAFIKIQNKGQECGCVVDSIERGNVNSIFIDRYKQWRFNLKDGDEVTVEVFNPAFAQRVILLAPPDFSDKDKERFIGKPLIKGEKTALFTFSGEPRPITVAETEPGGIVLVTKNTHISVKGDEAGEVPITYKDIGGLQREIRLIREAVEYPLRSPEVFEYLGVSQPKGIILHGPPGTGKTLIAKALAGEVGAKFFQISGPEVFSKYVGDSEKELRDIFDKAEKSAPAVILIDELDSLAPKRGSSHGEVEQRLVATLLTKMDGLKQLKGVVVVGTTNRINSIDPALRREGRFGHEVNIGVPDSQGRREILGIHTRRMPLSENVDLDSIAQRTHGFVGADITSLCREAAYNALRRSFPEDAFEKGEIIPGSGLMVTQADFDKALPSVPPSAMRELMIEIPVTTWDDIGGLDEVKRLLIENITYAITKRDVFKRIGIRPARGVLLYGPPGTGKTLLAKAVANQSGANFISVKGPEIRSKWVGESEERIRFLFAKAREVAPCVIFFDEIDATVPARGRDVSGAADTIVNQILSEMDGIQSAEGVFVIGATNRIELLDPAVLRPGRFDYQIEVPLPDNNTRRSIFSVQLKGKPIKETDYESLAHLSEGFSGADIAEVCREAVWDAIREAGFDAEKVSISQRHIIDSLHRIAQHKSKMA